MAKIKEKPITRFSFDMSGKRKHFHLLRDLSDGTVTFCLDDSFVKELFYACKVNSKRSKVLEEFVQNVECLFW